MADESNNSKKFDIRTIATIIGMVVMLGGLAGQWFVHKAAVAGLQKDVTKVEEVFTEYREKTDDRILNMKLNISSSSSDITTIKEDIGEIKADLKTLLTRPE